jgi:hypothetical protein
MYTLYGVVTSQFAADVGMLVRDIDVRRLPILATQLTWDIFLKV